MDRYLADILAIVVPRLADRKAINMVVSRLRTSVWCRVAVLLAVVTLSGCAGGLGKSLPIPVQPIDHSHVPDAPLDGRLYQPNGPGPFPVVIVLHGCGGLVSNVWNWQRRLLGWGYAVFVLDSFSARGVSEVCEPAAAHLVTVKDRAADVISAALLLRTQPEIDGTRIAVLGLSHGGATAVRITQRRYEGLHPGLLAASVDYYGECGSAAAHGSVPLLVLAGESDNWDNPAQDCRAFAGSVSPNQPVEVHTYPGAGHKFDDPDQLPVVFLGHPLGYNANAAQDSFEQVRMFLDKWVLHRSSNSSP